MRNRVIYAVVTLFFLQACDAPSGVTTPGAGTNLATGPVTGETYELPTSAPVQVTGLKAFFIAPKVKLTWDKVEGAFGYEIYRQNESLPQSSPTGARLAVPGSRRDLVYENDFNDLDVDLGHKYTYRVVAVNTIGKGKASKPVAVNALLFPGWLQAPAGGPAFNPIDFDWDDAIGSAGGNQGISSTTLYPAVVTQYASCTGYGAALGAVRPAVNALLPNAPQTFAFDINYNLGDNHYYEFSAKAVSVTTGTQLPVYLETGTISGCGSKLLSFTGDFSGRDLQSLNITLMIYDEYGWDILYRGQSYKFENGVWLRIEETVPAAGATLSGGTLSARIRHNRLPTMNTVIQLDAGYSSLAFATLVTAVTGTGDFTLSIPYETECGYSSGRLRVFGDNEFFYLSESLSYPMSSTHSERMHLSNREVWLSPPSIFSGYLVSLNVSSCVASPTEVTLAASPGWQIYRWASGIGEQYSTVVTGMTNNSYALRMLPSSAGNFGTVTGTATAYFPSGTTRSATLRAHTFDYFWKVPPPQQAAANVTYPLEVTVAGPRPLHSISYDRYGSLYGRLSWSETTDVYSGSVSFPSCREYYFYAGSVSPFGNTTPYAFIDVTTSSTVTINTNGTLWFNNGSIGPLPYSLTDTCGNSFTWSIVYAPAWLRFESLSGDSTTPLAAGVLKNTAFPNNSEYSVWGKIGVQANGAGKIFEIFVVAYRQ